MAASSREQQPSVVNDISMQIRSIDPKNHDPNVIKALLDTLLRVKNEKGDRVGEGDGFVHCLLCIQSVSNEISDLKFRVKLFWTGIEVKTEIHRLYEIPTNYQTLIVNRRVISDHETLENCHFQDKNQIVHIILNKNRVRYQNSGIRLRDFLPERNNDVPMEEESAQLLMSSQSSNELSRRQPLHVTSKRRDETELTRHDPTSLTSQSVDEARMLTSSSMPSTSQPFNEDSLLRQESGLGCEDDVELDDETPNSAHSSKTSAIVSISTPPQTRVVSTKGKKNKGKKKKKK